MPSSQKHWLGAKICIGATGVKIFTPRTRRKKLVVLSQTNLSLTVLG